MKRREFIILLGGAAATWPVVARAQRSEKIRRIGVLMNLAADDSEAQIRVAALMQGLQELGWSVGRNLRIDIRWGAGDADRYRRYATELVMLAPDVILAAGSTAMGPLQQATRDIPLIFVHVGDPVSAGFVASLAQPGGNASGFTSFEFGMSGKWLELLKQIAPNLTRVAVLRDRTNPSGIGELGAIQAVAPSFAVELSPLDAVNAAEIERAVTSFSRTANGGLIALPTGLTTIHRDLIVKLAARYQLPAVYPYRYFVTAGGLMSYGLDLTDSFRRAAGYMDRILKGEKPGDLPVQQPTKFELVVNLRTAKALGLTMPPSLLARADEVIE